MQGGHCDTGADEREAVGTSCHVRNSNIVGEDRAGRLYTIPYKGLLFHIETVKKYFVLCKPDPGLGTLTKQLPGPVCRRRSDHLIHARLIKDVKEFASVDLCVPVRHRADRPQSRPPSQPQPPEARYVNLRSFIAPLSDPGAATLVSGLWLRTVAASRPTRAPSESRRSPEGTLERLGGHVAVGTEQVVGAVEPAKGSPCRSHSTTSQ